MLNFYIVFLSYFTMCAHTFIQCLHQHSLAEIIQGRKGQDNFFQGAEHASQKVVIVYHFVQLCTGIMRLFVGVTHFFFFFLRGSKLKWKETFQEGKMPPIYFWDCVLLSPIHSQTEQVLSFWFIFIHISAYVCVCPCLPCRSRSLTRPIHSGPLLAKIHRM